MSQKDFQKVKEYFTGGRKLGFAVVIMAQNYVSIPKTIVRNCQYFIIFKLNDNVTINNILKTIIYIMLKRNILKSFFKKQQKNNLIFF